MAVVYIKSEDNQDIIALDCTTSFSKERSNSVTQSSVMSGANVSDTFHVGTPTFTLEGLVTYNKRSGEQDRPDPLEFQKLIDNLVNSYKRFTVIGDGHLFTSFKNCVLTSESYIQDRYLDTLTVSLTFQQVYVTTAAQRTRLSRPQASVETQGQLASETDKGNGTKTEVTEDQGRTLFQYLADIASEPVLGAEDGTNP